MIVVFNFRIVSDHAFIYYQKETVTITPSQGKVLLNGVAVTTKKELHHNDR